MEIFIKILVFIGCVCLLISAEQCMVSVSYSPSKVEFTCAGILTLEQKLNAAYQNTTDITIQDSDLISIPGKPFLSFGQTLKSLDIHQSRVRNIDTDVFWGLLYLEKLSLWGNNLTWIPHDWFTHLTNLRTLDISFNNVEGIDYKVYYKVPNLNTLNIAYNRFKKIDYSLISAMTQLKKFEFGKNPWDWSYRVLLTWQLDNQRVDYRDSWDDWGWMSNAIQHCQNSGYAVVPDVKLLHCGFRKLVEFLNTHLPSTFQNSSTLLNSINPSVQASSRLNQCVKSKLNTNGDLLPLKLLETLSHDLQLIGNPLAMFHYP